MTANEKPKLGAMLLAAGGSSRLGQPKQMLVYEGETLLKRAARSLADSVYFPVVVVLGSSSDSALLEIAGLPVYHAINEKWADGMSSSIKVGLRKMLEIEPDLDGVLIALCDQPKITTEKFDQFAAKFIETPASVIAAKYEGVAGVPSLFRRDAFDELFSLEGDKGAREIIRNRLDLITIDLPEAKFDIDTPADADQLS